MKHAFRLVISTMVVACVACGEREDEGDVNPFGPNPVPFGGREEPPEGPRLDAEPGPEIEAQGPQASVPTTLPGQEGLDPRPGMPYFERTLDGRPLAAEPPRSGPGSRAEPAREGAAGQQPGSLPSRATQEQLAQAQTRGQPALGTVSIAEDIASACRIEGQRRTFSFDARSGSVGEEEVLRELASCFEDGALAGRALVVAASGDGAGTWSEMLRVELENAGLTASRANAGEQDARAADTVPAGAKRSAELRLAAR